MRAGDGSDPPLDFAAVSVEEETPGLPAFAEVSVSAMTCTRSVKT
jgi:hypothetical protein